MKSVIWLRHVIMPSAVLTTKPTHEIVSVSLPLQNAFLTLLSAFPLKLSPSLVSSLSLCWDVNHC